MTPKYPRLRRFYPQHDVVIANHYDPRRERLRKSVALKIIRELREQHGLEVTEKQLRDRVQTILRRAKYASPRTKAGQRRQITEWERRDREAISAVSEGTASPASPRHYRGNFDL